MFENMTYEAILTDMLSRVISDVDKKEGSVIYDALAPCAYQLAQNYFNLNNFIDLVSGDTAVGEYLDRVVADYGLSRKAATYAVRKIITTGEVAIGTRWGLNDTTYTITSLISANVYSATCNQLGTVGNTYSGELENIDNVSGVAATLSDIITSGTDEETDENLRERFYAKVQAPSTSGNADNYKEWALNVSGVGDAKVFPLWNGPGTVKVVIVNNEKQPVTTEEITKTTEYIEKVRPIGATVTIASGIAKAVDISAKVVLAVGYNLLEVTNSFKRSIAEYFESITFNQTYISYAKIGTILLSTDGVIDYKDLKLNNTTANIALTDEEIPLSGVVSLEV